MNTGAANAAVYVAAQREQVSTLPAFGTPLLDASRAQALEALSRHGLPSQRDEDWKYTSIRPITRSTFTPATSGAPCPADFISQTLIDGLDAWRLVFADGFWAPQCSQVGDLPDGVKILGLGAALAHDPEPLAAKLGSALGPIPHGFAAMNSAFVGDGAFVEIAAGTLIEKPIELLFVSGCSGEGYLSLPRNLIVLGAGSKATVIERHVSLSGERALTNSVSELILAANARLNYHGLQQTSERSFHVGGVFGKLGRSAQLKATTVTTGGSLVRNDARISLDKEGATVSLDGLYLAFGRRHVDNHTHIVHNAPHCTSQEQYKGVLGDRARAVFHGRIVVQPGAQKTDSMQSNQNLLLSADAEVDTKPQLEIYADDVKCAHGATVGQLDETAVFYLVSRGIGRETARRMLTQAFAADVLDRVEPPALRTYLESQSAEHLSFGELRDSES